MAAIPGEWQQIDKSNLTSDDIIFIHTFHITPILKTADACLVQNYHPISVLPAFSKIFDRIVYNRLFKFITENNILSNNQYGFRSGYFTSHALISFLTRLLMQWILIII